MRAPEVQDDPFGRAAGGVMLLDGIEQLLPAKPGVLGPEVAARHDDSRPHLSGIDDLAQGIIWVQANDNIIIDRHISPVIFRPARNTTKNPTARIHDVAIDVMPLTENAREHSLPARDISGASGLWEPGGNEVSRGFEPPLVTMKTMCRHGQTTDPDASSRVRWVRECSPAGQPACAGHHERYRTKRIAAPGPTAAASEPACPIGSGV
jgi:hypothetical protein